MRLFETSSAFTAATRDSTAALEVREGRELRSAHYHTFSSQAAAHQHMHVLLQYRHYCRPCGISFESDNNLGMFTTASGLAHHLETGACPRAPQLNQAIGMDLDCLEPAFKFSGAQTEAVSLPERSWYTRMQAESRSVQRTKRRHTSSTIVVVVFYLASQLIRRQDHPCKHLSKQANSYASSMICRIDIFILRSTVINVSRLMMAFKHAKRESRMCIPTELVSLDYPQH
nr:hypothetical protein CFP56_68156 [Quercus suber]